MFISFEISALKTPKEKMGDLDKVHVWEGRAIVQDRGKYEK